VEQKLNLVTTETALKVRQISDLDELPNVECIAEEMIPFKKRISGYRLSRNPRRNQNLSSSGMEFHPEAKQVEYVICPARLMIK
jgi:5-(carboxyamino)imidazole ribonucleotide synthase